MDDYFGILLCNTGSPSEPTPKALRKYLRSFLMNKRIAPFNRVVWSIILNSFILPRRCTRSASLYRSIWTDAGSPLIDSMKTLAHALCKELNSEGCRCTVVPAMSFGDLPIRHALKHLRAKGCNKLIVLPLYPQFAYSTTAIVEDKVLHYLKSMRWNVDFTFIDNYHKNHGYIEAISKLVEHAGFDESAGDKLLFSFHSIPISDVEKGDSYELQCSSSSLLIASELNLDRNSWTIGYQSCFDKTRSWLTPTTIQAAERIGEFSDAKLYVCCPGFSVENLETLFEIKHDVKKKFLNKRRLRNEAATTKDFVYVPCLGKTKLHVSVLKNIIKSSLEKK